MRFGVPFLIHVGITLEGLGLIFLIIECVGGCCFLEINLQCAREGQGELYRTAPPPETEKGNVFGQLLGRRETLLTGIWAVPREGKFCWGQWPEPSICSLEPKA